MTAQGLNWKVHLEKSTDDGMSWTKIPIDPKTEFNVIQPSILVLGDRHLQVLCRSRENSVMQAFSEDNGDTWGSITRTELPNPNSGTDAITLTNGYHLLVYNPTVKGKKGVQNYRWLSPKPERIGRRYCLWRIKKGRIQLSCCN